MKTLIRFRRRRDCSGEGENRAGFGETTLIAAGGGTRWTWGWDLIWTREKVRKVIIFLYWFITTNTLYPLTMRNCSPLLLPLLFAIPPRRRPRTRRCHPTLVRDKCLLFFLPSVRPSRRAGELTRQPAGANCLRCRKEIARSRPPSL